MSDSSHTRGAAVGATSRVPGPVEDAPRRSPYVSVVVTAHDRREYLRGAIESVLAQSLPRSEFEVIVVKLLPDPELDSWVAEQATGARVLTDGSLGRLGQKMAAGLRLARGEIVCFLEDDDRYLPRKLEVVAGRFRTDPALAYFRNRNRCIDAQGRPLIGPYARTADHDVRIPPGPRNDLATVDFIRHYGAEGNSAIALRRSLVLPELDRLAQFNTSADWLLFLTALARGESLVVGTEPLSEYRLHASLSQGASHDSRQRLGEEIVRSSAVLVDLARGTRAERAARFLRGRGAVNWYLIDPHAPRPSLETLRDAAWGAWLRREPTFAIQISWCGLRFLAPRAASEAYWGYHQRDAKRQRWTTEGPVTAGGATGPSGPGTPPG